MNFRSWNWTKKSYLRGIVRLYNRIWWSLFVWREMWNHILLIRVKKVKCDAPNVCWYTSSVRAATLILWLLKGPKPPARYGTESKNSIFLKQENYVSTLVLNQTLVVSLTLKSQWCKNKLSFLQKIISWSAKIENKYRFASFFDQENQRCLALDFLMKFSFPATKTAFTTKFRPSTEI